MNKDDIIKKIFASEISSIQFPIAKRIYSSTISDGAWIKSEKQQAKEDRINKLRLLQGEEPNVTLPNDLFKEGILSVTPMSKPTDMIFYFDYVYG